MMKTDGHILFALSIAVVLSTVLFLGASYAMADVNWTVDSQTEWKANTLESINLDFEDGHAKPTADKAVFKSKVKRFKNKTWLQSIVFEQWPDWQNWKQIAKAPAAIDLGDLPACYGFQFEFNATKTTENGVLPVMDKVTIAF